MSILVVWVVIPSSSSGARYLRGGQHRLKGTVAEPAQRKPPPHCEDWPASPRASTARPPGTGHSPKRDDFGGHRLRRHPVGACQSKIGCNRDPRSGGRQAPRSDRVTERRESCGRIRGGSQIGSCQGLTYLHAAFVSHEQVGHLQISAGEQRAAGQHRPSGTAPAIPALPQGSQAAAEPRS